MVDTNIEKIDLIDRGNLEGDVSYLIEGANPATHSNPNPDSKRMSLPVYNFVIEHSEATVLWDTGVHPAAKEGHWHENTVEVLFPSNAEDHPLNEDLNKAGYSIEEIDLVVMSHLHLDHAGGLEVFAGRETPIYVHREELSHAYVEAKTGGDPGYVPGDFDHDLNWQLLTKTRHSLLEGFELIHLPGHTPGLLGALLHHDSAGSLIFTSDAFHLKENFEGPTPTGGPLVWSSLDWWDSYHTVKELERRHDAKVVVGHDPDQVKDIGDGWS